LNGAEVSEYPRNVVAQGEMERKAAEVFEPLWRRVFGCREISRRTTVDGDSERTNAPSTATTSRYARSDIRLVAGLHLLRFWLIIAMTKL